MNQLDLRQIKHVKKEFASNTPENPSEEKEDKQLKLTEAKENQIAKKMKIKRGGGLKQMLLKKGMTNE